uniref:Ras family GTPase n=1 Tax=Pithovirus LCPAC404 TaxID=2506597 RepID=A0A481ZEY3_9VIRU|nr:MAG: Ras family GTPase [Pithovirus LCPAC404]
MNKVDRIFRHMENHEDYFSTLGVELDCVYRDECNIDIWDIGSKHLGLGIEYTRKCDGIILFHDEDNNDPPFEPPTNVPIVHVLSGYWNEEDVDNTPLQLLITTIMENN